jgi:hypothetical protein
MQAAMKAENYEMAIARRKEAKHLNHAIILASGSVKRQRI